MLDCDFCSREKITSCQHREYGVICENCSEALEGKSFNPDSYDRKFENGDLVVWIKDEKIVSAWFDDGSTAIPKSVLDMRKTIPETVKWLINHKNRGLVFCSYCARACSPDEIEHRHFAGMYCGKCAKKYKKENSRACGICKSPQHSCVC